MTSWASCRSQKVLSIRHNPLCLQVCVIPYSFELNFSRDPVKTEEYQNPRTPGDQALRWLPACVRVKSVSVQTQPRSGKHQAQDKQCRTLSRPCEVSIFSRFYQNLDKKVNQKSVTGIHKCIPTTFCCQYSTLQPPEIVLVSPVNDHCGLCSNVTRWLRDSESYRVMRRLTWRLKSKFYFRRGRKGQSMRNY